MELLLTVRGSVARPEPVRQSEFSASVGNSVGWQAVFVLFPMSDISILLLNYGQLLGRYAHYHLRFYFFFLDYHYDYPFFGGTKKIFLHLSARSEKMTARTACVNFINFCLLLCRWLIVRSPSLEELMCILQFSPGQTAFHSAAGHNRFVQWTIGWGLYSYAWNT